MAVQRQRGDDGSGGVGAAVQRDHRQRQQRRFLEQRSPGHLNGTIVGKSALRGTATSEVSMFVEGRVRISRQTLLLRLEGFNLFNNANILGRAQTTYGDTGTPVPTFGQLVSVSGTTAIPALANIDTPRMFQFQIRYQF